MPSNQLTNCSSDFQFQFHVVYMLKQQDTLYLFIL